MSAEVALDVPSGFHDDQASLTSPITVRPSLNVVDVIVTAPSPPVSHLVTATNPCLTNSLDLSDTTETSSTLQDRPTPNGSIVRRDRDTRPNSLPNQPRPSPRRPHDRLGRHKTISGVTEEARKVLEQFLTKSLSQEASTSDLLLSATGRCSSELPVPSPAARGSSLPDRRTVSEDVPDGLGATHQTSAPCGLNHGSSQQSNHHQHQQVAAPDTLHPAHNQVPPTCQQQRVYRDSVAMPDDDATSHSPMSCPNSLYSFSSRSSSNRNRIQITKNFKDEKELMKEAEQQQRKRKNKKKRERGRRRESKDSSSSSEYEIINGQLQRRKKSLFKRAKERIRASFRRSRKEIQSFDPYRIDEDEIRAAEELRQQPAKASKEKKGFNFHLPRRSRSSAERSPTSEQEAGTQIRRHRSQGHPEASRWAVVREQHQQEKDPSRGIFDSLLRSLRRGSSKLKRSKGSSKDGSGKLPPRSHSADHLVHHGVNRNESADHFNYPFADQWVANGHPDGQPQSKALPYCRCQSEDGTRSHHISQQTNTTRPSVEASQPHLPANHQVLPPSARALHLTDHSRAALADRSQLHLQGLRSTTASNGPATLAHPEHRLLVVEDQRSQRGSSVEHSSFDDIDGVAPSAPSSTPSKQEQVVPFAQKTDEEKDELYEKIANQLAAIADNYNLDSPCSLKNDLFRSSPLGVSTIPKSASAPAAAAVAPSTAPVVTTSPPTPKPAPESEETGATGGLTVPTSQATGGAQEGGARSGGRTPIEQKIGRILRDKGDMAAVDMTELEPVVSELVRNASYSRFQQIIHENVGSEPGWQQVAILFNLTSSAVRLAGLGTAAALQIKELTLRYFEDRFAGWIVGQGGWESMVEDTDLSSEVD